MTHPHIRGMTRAQREAARARRRLLKLAKRQIRTEEAARAVPHPAVVAPAEPAAVDPAPTL